VKLGLASYTFRNFTRDQMIADMKQLHVNALNAKDVKDHLPVDPTQEAAAVADYTANGMRRARSTFPRTKMTTSAVSSSTASARTSVSSSLEIPLRKLSRVLRSS
jgi:hypothetical protein